MGISSSCDILNGGGGMGRRFATFPPSELLPRRIGLFSKGCANCGGSGGVKDILPKEEHRGEYEFGTTIVMHTESIGTTF